MTTKITIHNSASSNGDVHIRAQSTWDHGRSRLAPGESTQYGITDSSIMAIFESMPASLETSPALIAGERADEIIAKEVAGQDKMWGVANERTDADSGQLLAAGLAQLEALFLRRSGETTAFDTPPTSYPSDWSGFRDYGSDVANLAVAAAFIRQEMKRLIATGAATTRTARNPETQPYKGDQPATQL